MSLTNLFVILHLVGLVIGLGSATVGDAIFFKALRTKRLAAEEFTLLQTISRLIWIGIAILILSGIGLVVVKFQTVAGYHIPAKLWLKFILTGIIAGNGLFIHYRIYPLLAQSVDKPLATSPLAKHLRALTISGAVSLISWWSAFLLGSLRGLPLSFIELLGIYLVIILVGVITAPVIGMALFKQSSSKSTI
ncbi:hypothetical protein HY523_00825 [Candidatus Berkelbacteria bacterium]|nr:hypothetical protein [Candidatus Berkelbacteria bacterium]